MTRVVVLQLLVGFAFGCLSKPEQSSTDKYCSSQEHKVRPNLEVISALTAHKLWLQDSPEGDRAILKHLENLRLFRSDLRNADLGGASACGVNFANSDLSGANLMGADLREAYFADSRLRQALLISADLRGADLKGADLSGARLQWSKLQGANLEDSVLDSVDLRGADLSGAVFEPRVLPEVRLIVEAQGLTALEFRNIYAISQLREAFKAAGLRRQEREVTYAINHVRHIDDPGSLIRYLLFEWTFKWGLAPGRIIGLIAGIILVFGLIYSLLLLGSSSSSGIYRVWHRDREKEYLTRHNCNPLLTGFFYSWVSSFYAIVAAQETFLGNTDKLLKESYQSEPKQYSLRADGWPGTLSKIQFFLSAAVVVLCLWTYFGRPLE